MAKFIKITLGMEFVVMKACSPDLTETSLKSDIKESDIQGLKDELLREWEKQLPPGASLTVCDVEIKIVDV